jgi:hypothetical protein
VLKYSVPRLGLDGWKLTADISVRSIFDRLGGKAPSFFAAPGVLIWLRSPPRKGVHSAA